MTNQLPKVGLVIGLLLAAAVESAAQQLSEGEFEAIVSAGHRTLEKRLRERPHRITTTVTAGRATSQQNWIYIKEVFERGSDGETRSRREEGVHGNKQSFEIIIIDGVCYKKTGVERWRRSPLMAVTPMLRPAMGLEADTFAKRLIGSKRSFHQAGVRKFNGENHGTYTSTVTESYIYEMNGKDIQSESVDTYFIRPDGMIAKYERAVTVISQANGVNTVYRFVVEWETDSAFIIAAPHQGA